MRNKRTGTGTPQIHPALVERIQHLNNLGKSRGEIKRITGCHYDTLRSILGKAKGGRGSGPRQWQCPVCGFRIVTKTCLICPAIAERKESKWIATNWKTT